MKIINILGVLASMASAVAAAEPVDKNHSGVFLGGSAQFGQSFQAGSGDSGAAFGLGVEAGFIAKRDTWNRFEIGGELSTASLGFENENSVKISIEDFNQALVKFGYGYSLGNHVFSVFRVGAGVGQGDYEIGNFTADAPAIIGMVGWDAVIPMGDHFDLLFGANYRVYKFTPDDIDSFQLNSTSLYAQARMRI